MDGECVETWLWVVRYDGGPPAVVGTYFTEAQAWTYPPKCPASAPRPGRFERALYKVRLPLSALSLAEPEAQQVEVEAEPAD